MKSCMLDTTPPNQAKLAAKLFANILRMVGGMCCVMSDRKKNVCIITHQTALLIILCDQVCTYIYYKIFSSTAAGRWPWALYELKKIIICLIDYKSIFFTQTKSTRLLSDVHSKYVRLSEQLRKKKLNFVHYCIFLIVLSLYR